MARQLVRSECLTPSLQLFAPSSKHSPLWFRNCHCYQCVQTRACFPPASNLTVVVARRRVERLWPARCKCNVTTVSVWRWRHAATRTTAFHRWFVSRVEFNKRSCAFVIETRRTRRCVWDLQTSNGPGSFFSRCLTFLFVHLSGAGVTCNRHLCWPTTTTNSKGADILVTKYMQK